MTRTVAYAFVAVLLAGRNSSLPAQASRATLSSRKFVVTLRDSLVLLLAARDAQIKGTSNALGWHGSANELIKNICEAMTGGGAKHPMALLREYVSITGTPGSDSTLYVQHGAECIRGRGAAALQSVRILVVAADVYPTIRANVLEQIDMTSSLQLYDPALDGVTARWLWTPKRSWWVQRYERGGMDDLPRRPPEPLVRLPILAPPPKP